MIALKGSAKEKLKVIADVTEKYAKSKFISSLLDSVGVNKDWYSIYRWVRESLKYKREKPGKDVLLEPHESLSGVYADCEDYTVLLGSLLRRAGYPVRIRLISNGTYHVYPEVGLPPNNPRKWVGLDAVTGRIGDVRYPGYRTVSIEGVGSIEGVDGGDNLKEEKVVEISLSEPLNPGDRIRLIYKPIPFVPDFVERWFYSKISTFRHPDFSVQRVWKDEKKNEWVVEVVVIKPEQEEQASVTAAIIASALAIGMIATYFTLKRVEKVVEVAKTPITAYSIYLVLGGLALLLGKKKAKGG